MKNVLRRVLFVFMLVFSISSWGKNLVSVIKVEKGDAKSLHINLSDFTQTSFFKINDENDFTLYKENIKNIDFSKKYV